MKVVFLEEVPGSALVGDVKEVKKGYARNFLLPRGLAIPATKDNIRRGGKIDGARISLTARVGEQGRLYGSITAAKIADELSRIAGEEVDHRQVLLGQSIRTVGTQEIRVRLTRNVFATATVEIAPEQGEVEQPTIAEAVAAVEAEGAAGSGDATVENTSEPPAEGPGSNE